MLTKLLIPHQYAPYVSLLAASLLVLPAGSMYGFGAYSTQLAVALGKRNSDVDTLGSAGDLGVYLGFTVGICWDICGSQVCMWSVHSEPVPRRERERERGLQENVRTQPIDSSYIEILSPHHRSFFLDNCPSFSSARRWRLSTQLSGATCGPSVRSVVRHLLSDRPRKLRHVCQRSLDNVA